MSADGYRCDTCSRPGVRVRPIPGVGRTDPSVSIGAGLGPCGRDGCAGELRAIPVDQADRELREALIEAGVIVHPDADDYDAVFTPSGALVGPVEPEPI